IVYVLEDNVLEVGDSNLNTAARQISSEFTNGLVRNLKRGSGLFNYDEKSRQYKLVRDKSKKTIISQTKLDTPEEQIKFLGLIGIPFTREEYQQMKPIQKHSFSSSVKGIRKSLEESDNIKFISTKMLNIKKRLLTLAENKAAIKNPEFNSTFFNSNGERVQTYLGVNVISNLYDYLSKINNINELEGTPYEYLLTDVFSQNSHILNKIFDRQTGERIQGTEDVLKPGWADGTI